MAHGLETRAPFLDRDLLEFALSIPHDLKVRGGELKVVLKEACAQYWPPELRTRGKLGFGAPYGHWLRRADVREHVKRVFAHGSALRRLLPGISATAPQGHDFRTWTLLTLGLWLERHPASA
jgi:asparagine synthase (glutamine-hydrolysing)